MSLEKTPQNNRVRSLLSHSESPGRNRQIIVPASPYLERLGYGTGVSVYLMERTAKHGGYNSPWAVKKVAKRFANKENQDFSKRLLKEADILRELKHPNIIGFRTITKAVDGTWCLAMEKAEHSLMDLIEERLDTDQGPFLPEEIRCVGFDIAKALNYLHTDQLLMHGDIKSANVLIFGKFALAKLCDFGVALKLKDTDGETVPNSYYIGTEAWTAPEIIGVDVVEEEVVVTNKADIFSYGLTIWEMLSLSLPHSDLLDMTEMSDISSSSDETGNEEIYREALGSRPPLPNLPYEPDYKNAVTVFIAATEEDPSRRPQAAELITMWMQ